MRYIKCVALLGLLVILAGTAHAQSRVQFGIGIGVGPGPAYGSAYDIGPPPACSYGYYDYYPYVCAPYGYYGPSYFYNGVFVGAGPWFRGGYYGRDDRRFYDRDDRRFQSGGQFRGNTGPRGGFQGGSQFRGNSGPRGGSQGGGSRGVSHGGGRR